MSEAPSLTTEQTTAEDLDEILAEELTSMVPPPPDPPPAPRVDLSLVRFSPELLDTIPQEIAEQYRVLPVYLRKPKKKKRSSTPGLLYIVAADPNDHAALEDCSLCCNLQVRAFLADPQEIAEAIPIVYRGGQLARPESPASITATPEPPAASTPAPTPEEAAAPAPAAPSTPATSAEAPPVPTPETPVLAPPVNGTAPSSGAAPPESRPTSSSMPELPLVRPTGPGALTVPSPAPESQAPPTAPTSPQTPEPEEPLLVVLGGDTTLANYGHEAIAPLGGHVDVWEFGQTSSKEKTPTPTLLLVSEEVYLFDRRAFNLLAFRLGVPLVVWSHEMDPADLQAVLLGARRRSKNSPSIPPV